MAITTTTNLSDLEFRNRIDGELYNPRLMESFFELKRSKLELFPLSSFCLIKSGTTPKDRDDMLKEGPILFKTTDIRNNVLSPFDTYYHICESIHNRMAVTKLRPYDVLLNIVGATLDVIGRSSIIMDDFQEANITQAMAFLRIRKKEFLPGYLFAFLNTKYAQNQIKRYARPTGQFNLNLVEVGKLMVPKLPHTHQQNIENLIVDCTAYQKQSHIFYHQAETLLAKELQLDQLELPNKKWYTAKYYEVVGNGRCDGEYYQPKYKQLMQHLARFECKTLGSLCVFTKGIEIGSSAYKEQGKLFMRVSNISENGIQTGNSDKHLSDIDYQRLKPYQIENGDILCTKDGTIAMCYVIDNDVEGIFSSGIVKLSLNDDVPAEYLTIVINSIFGKMQANRDCSGALITHWKIGDMKKMLIPIISDNKMIEIADLVSRSKEAKQESKKLLAQAKRRVEELIEQEVNKYEQI